MNLPIKIPFFGALLSLIFPAPVFSLPIAQFDKMPIEVQAEFIATMVDVTERTLRERGEATAADTMVRLFGEIKAGDIMPIGLIVLEEYIDRARVADLQRVQKDPNAQRLQVEHALFLTMKKMGAEIPRETANNLLGIFRNFHAMTYAEFQSMQIADQRRYLFRMARVGLPDYELRIAYEKAERKEATGDPKRYKENRELENEIIRKNFPAGAGIQPGFDAVANKVRNQSASHPNDSGPFYELNMYVMRQTSTELERQMREMEDKTYHLRNRP